MDAAHRQTSGGLWKVAIALGLLPLCAGLGVFAFWLVTRWDWLQLAGFYVIVAGALMVAAGLVALLAYAAYEFDLRRLAIGLFILLVNFPAAAGVAWSASYVASRYTVHVMNDSGGTIDFLILSGGEVAARIDGLTAGASRAARFVPRPETGISFRFLLGGEERHGPIYDYPTGMNGRVITVLVLPHGEVIVTGE